MDPLDAAWQELTGRLEAGSLSGVAATLDALAQSPLADDARSLKRARGVLDGFWDLVHCDPKRALAESTLAVAVASARSELLLVAELSRQRAVALFALGRSKESLGASEGGLQAIGDVHREGDAQAARIRADLLGFHSNALLAQGQVRAALVALEEAIALARAHGLEAQLAGLLSSLGNARLYSGDARAAEEYYEQALELAQTHKNKEGQAVGLGNLGLVQLVRGDLEDALDLFEQALGKAREIGDRRSAATVEANIGLALSRRGDLEGASRRFDVSRSLAEQLGDKATEAISLLRMAGVARARGAKAQAEGLLDQAQAALERVDAPAHSSLLNERGRLALDLQDWPTARALFGAALEAARSVRDPRAEAVALYDLGRVALARGDLAEATGHLGAALDLAQELDSRPLCGLVRSTLAELCAAKGDAAGAQAALAAAEHDTGPGDAVASVRLLLARAATHAAVEPGRARALLQRAMQESRERGLNALTAEARRRRDALEPPP